MAIAALPGYADDHNDGSSGSNYDAAPVDASQPYDEYAPVQAPLIGPNLGATGTAQPSSPAALPPGMPAAEVPQVSNIFREAARQYGRFGMVTGRGVSSPSPVVLSPREPASVAPILGAVGSNSLPGLSRADQGAPAGELGDIGGGAGSGPSRYAEFRAEVEADLRDRTSNVEALKRAEQADQKAMQRPNGRLLRAVRRER